MSYPALLGVCVSVGSEMLDRERTGYEITQRHQKTCLTTMRKHDLFIYYLFIYLFISVLFREWKTYFKDPYNYFDWLGLVLTFLVIPLRFVEVQSQWSVAGLGYLFNFLRLFKFSCVTRYFIFLRISTRVKRLMLRPHIIPLEESVQTIRLRLFTRGKIKIIH